MALSCISEGFYMRPIFYIAFLALLSCKHTAAQIPYDLDQPDKQYTLPKVLNEISGITDLDNTHLAFVQDEIGKIFIFHLPSGKIVNEFAFDSLGDFEGLSFTGQSLFILRSDGRLTEWKDFNLKNGGGEITHDKLALQSKDNEGLCFDRQNKRLLIAAKSKPEASSEKSARYVYSYDLSSRQLSVDKNYSINTEELGVKAKEFGARGWPVNAKGKSKSFNFRPSSLAIHPVSGQLYILSATDQMLVIMDKHGDIQFMQALGAKLFPKAEGITFLTDGTMIISNEADGNVATILQYKMK